MTCQSLINYFIVDTISGITYEPYVCMDSYLVAYPNTANGKQTVINFSRLTKGLTERRYRLTPKQRQNTI